jgi:flagellar hook protein FlgE
MFYTAISGLNAFSQQLSTISNNVANSETTAYKSTGTSFAEILNSSTSSSSSGNVGDGVTLQSNTVDWSQGTVASTGNSNNFAITGSGFFVVRNTAGVTSYTRDGEFSYNSDGTLVNAEGMTVQGYAIDAAGNVSTTLSDITISNALIPGTATSSMTTTANLNSSAATGDTFSATVNTYDSLGNTVALTITFTKVDPATATNEWTWTASIPTASGTATGSGTLDFDTSGALVASTDPTISLALTNGAATPQVVTWDLYNAAGTTNGDLTQCASTSALSDSSQDGTAAGQIESISTDSKGIITASYSNGKTSSLYQIALAGFTNEGGLSKTGDGLYIQTSSSGEPTYGVAKSGQFGTLTSGSLEASNIDLAKELANMIIAQRAYESCAKVFTTESDMMKTLVNMT